ncbi:for [Symbiodinium natans]|uniref:For protein n=1 Tax=Symbiodinium natans TaxID=878477 RepID=A0A812MFT1_9DINO|nr:for [Symbiodinium natans]
MGQRLCGGHEGCSCVEGLLPTSWRMQQYNSQREEFEERVKFLETVPVFANQLPRADLPRVAEALEMKMFRPGELLAKQGDVGQELKVIKTGTAAVVMKNDGTTGMMRQTSPASDGDDGEQRIATLHRGDWSGGYALVQTRAFRASVVAEPPGVTCYTLSRQKFEDLGLHECLHFPRRAAMYEGHAKRAGNLAKRMPGVTPVPGKLTEEELDFIVRSLCKNMNLRSAIDLSERIDRVKELASRATRLRVPQQRIIVEGGSAAEDFFVVCSGVAEAIPENFTNERRGHGASGAEEMVDANSLSYKLLQKAAYLQDMMRGGDDKCVSNDLAKSLKEDAKVGMRSKIRRKKGGSMVYQEEKKGLQELLDDEASARTPRRGDKKGKNRLFRVNTIDYTGEQLLYVGERVREKKHFVTFKGIAGSGLTGSPLLGNRRKSSTSLEVEAEVGRVEAILDHSRVVVSFPSKGVNIYNNSDLSLARDEATVELQSGDVYGEVALLYNTRHLATFKAGREELLLYAINRSDFKECLFRQAQMAEAEKYGALLAEVRILSSLLDSERRDLARNATREITFKAGHCILAEKNLRELRRGDHFGERSAWREQVLKSLGLDAFAGLECMEQDVCTLKPTGWQVILQQDPATGKKYALKQISKRGIRLNGVELHIRNERNLHAMVNSPFIVHLHASYRDRPAPDMGHRMHTELSFYAACIVEGLGHLHERKGYAKICDLGFARFVLRKTYTFLGTPEYMAPEILNFPHEHDERVDWWALGVLMFELLSGQTPWHAGDNQADAPYTILRSQQVKMTAGGGGGKRCQRARRAAPRAEVDDGAGVGDGLKRPTGTLRDAQAAASDEDGERLVDPGQALLAVLDRLLSRLMDSCRESAEVQQLPVGAGKRMPNTRFAATMAARHGKRLCEGPKLSEHPLFGALREFEACQKFLDEFGSSPTLECSPQKPVDQVLASGMVRLRIPKSGSDGSRDLWMCAGCGWCDFTAGSDRALFHKLGGMSKAAWLQSGPDRPARTEADFTAALFPQNQVAKLAMEGIKPAQVYCEFQQWAVARQELDKPGDLDLQHARELQVLEIVETASAFSRAQHPRTRQLLSYISAGRYQGISRPDFCKILASFYEECTEKGLQLARAGPGTLSFDGQFSQGHCMVNLWLSNNAGRLRLGTEDFKDSKQDAPRMASFAVEAVQRIGADHVSAIVTDGPSVMRNLELRTLRPCSVVVCGAVGRRHGDDRGNREVMALLEKHLVAVAPGETTDVST